MSNENRDFDHTLEVNRADIDHDDALRLKWDQDWTGHHCTRDKLGGQKTEAVPRCLLWQKTLNVSDASCHKNRFVVHIDTVENSFFRCLSPEQRNDLCSNEATIKVLGLGEDEQEWELEYRRRVLPGNNSISYVLQENPQRRIRKGGRKKDRKISKCEIPHKVPREQCNSRPEDGLNQMYLVITSNEQLLAVLSVL